MLEILGLLLILSLSPCPFIVYYIIMPNLGVIYLSLVPLGPPKPLGPLVPLGSSVPTTRVWGTHREVFCHLLHVHA